MNALAALTPPGFHDWLAQGRDLLHARSDAEWALADWIADGKTRFGRQLEMDLLAGELGIAPKRLRSAAKVAATFPPALRSPALPFAVHEEIARVDADDRLPMLKQAADGRWNEKVAHERVEQRRIAVSPASAPDDDEEDRLGVALVRAWNRIPTLEAREHFWPYLERAARQGFGAINLGEVSDD